MLVDLLRRLVKLAGVEGHGYQRRLIAQPAGVEDGADLAQHVLPLQFGQAGQHLIFIDAHLFAQFQVRPFHHGKRRLDQVQ